ncbi:hypothetical protein GF407_19450 [candidate division KSB1 bacterium]|nr:hypothetical protein [candidate division KSB1 bacterium]
MTSKSQLFGVVFLVFSLIVILVVFSSMKQNLTDPVQEYPRLRSVNEGVVDSVYYNYIFHFSLILPHSKWTVASEYADSTLSPYEKSQPIPEQVKEIITVRRQGGHAALRVGVISKAPELEARDFAISLLYEMLHQSREQQDSIIKPVSAPAHRILQGYYFILLKTGSENDRVIITSVLPRRDYYYILRCTVDRNHYDSLQQECEWIMKGFKPLLSTFRPSP